MWTFQQSKVTWTRDAITGDAIRSQGHGRHASLTDMSATPVELIRSAALTDHAPYAYAAVTHNVSRLVFTAGACPLDADGNVVAPGDIAAQAQQVMANLVVALAAAGARLTDVAKTTVYVASSDRSDLV